MWVQLGLEPDSFWTKTPREVEIIIEARWDAEVRKHNELAWLAWHIVALGRRPKMLALERLLVKKPSGRKRKTAEEIMAVMSMWAAKMRVVAAHNAKVKK